MTSNKILTALSLVVTCSSMIALSAGAHDYRNNANEQLIMNNFNTAENNISTQLNGYVNSGQLSPQAAASFNSELSQIASQSMLDPGNSNQVQQALNQFSSLTSQIQSSLAPVGTYTGGVANPYVYGAATQYNNNGNPNFYNNWRSRLGIADRYNNNRYNPALNNNLNVQAGKEARAEQAINRSEAIDASRGVGNIGAQERYRATMEHAEQVNAAKQANHQAISDQMINHERAEQAATRAGADIRANQAINHDVHNAAVNQAVRSEVKAETRAVAPTAVAPAAAAPAAAAPAAAAPAAAAAAAADHKGGHGDHHGDHH